MAQAPLQSTFQGLAIGAIEDADQRLSARLISILQAVSAASSGSMLSAAERKYGGGGADLSISYPEHEVPKVPGGVLFDLWTKPYGGYWEKPTDGEVAGSTGARGGIAAGADLPLDGRWTVGVLGGVDYAEIGYSNGEEIDTTALFVGADARFSDDSGYFGGATVVGGYSSNKIQQPVSLLRVGVVEEHADYDASFFAVAGRIGKRMELAGANGIRLTASGSYVGEWTDAYSYDGLIAGLFDVDSHYAQALDGSFEVAYERRHSLARGGVFEVFTGLLGHYQLSGEQSFLIDTNPFDIPDPSVEAYAGFVGAGITSRIGFNWGVGARAQFSYASDETKAMAAYLRVLGVF